MVYLNEHIKRLRNELMKGGNLTCLAYLFASDLGNTDTFLANFSGEEEVAANGYLNKEVDKSEIESILNKKPYKGFGITDSVYKLIGIHLASGNSLEEKVNRKFENSSLKSKYFITKCLPGYKNKLKPVLASNELAEPISVILSVLFGKETTQEIEQDVLRKFITAASDVIDLLILEDLENHYLSQSIVKESYLNKTPKELILDLLSHFREASKKVTDGRRKDHKEFEINDEYDVQDLLYTILKSIFPKLKEEDPTPRVGIKSNKIDLILREQGILIEVKMIKETDSNEKKFVEELKNDIQSYHQCQWLEYLICFVYDPFDKTRSKQNFYDLNGAQSINGKSFEITVIVG